MLELTGFGDVESQHVQVLELPYGRGEFHEGPGDTVDYRDNSDRMFHMSSHAEEQLATRLGIGWGYAAKCPGDLRALNYSYWTRHDGQLTFVGQALAQDEWKIMAVTSPNFTPISHDVLIRMFREKLAPILHTLDLTEESLQFPRSWIDNVTGKMNLNVVLPTGDRQVGRRVGDVVERGFRVVNDLSRDSILQVQPYYLQLVCTNGMTAVHGLEGSDYRWQVRHGPGGYEDEVSTWMEQTLSNVARIWSSHYHEMDALADTPVDSDTARDLIASLGRRYGNSRIAEQVGFQRAEHPYEGEESLWDLVSAFTATAREQLDPEAVVDLEAIGGQVLEDLHTRAFCEMCHRPLR